MSIKKFLERNKWVWVEDYSDRYRLRLYHLPLIYALFKGEEIIWVGWSGRLGRRLVEHRSKGFDGMMIKTVAPETVQASEAYWIGRLKPKYNCYHKWGRDSRGLTGNRGTPVWRL